MDTFIVGEDNCKINDVVLAMKTSTVFSELDGKWAELAITLGTPKELKNGLKTAQMIGLKSTLEIIIEILTEWKNRCSNDTRLNIFIDALESHSLNDIANCIKNKFKNIAININFETTKPDDFNVTQSSLKDHIDYNIVELIEKTFLSEQILSLMEATKMLSIDEIQVLKKARNRGDENRRFYQLVKEKVEKNDTFYDQLITIFADNSQNHRNGAYYLLNSFYDK